MARPKFIPTDEQIAQVKSWAGVGLPHDDIAILLGIAPKTLKRAFKNILDDGKIRVKANLRGKAYSLAMQGNTAVLIFLLKTMCGLKEREDGKPDTDALPALTVTVTAGPKSEQ